MPPGLVSSAALSSRRACNAVSCGRSRSLFSQGMSGCRRMVPVEEQGASSSTASNGPAFHSVASAVTISTESFSRARFCRSRRSRGSRAVHGGDVCPRARKLRGLAARRSAQISHAHAATSPRRRAGNAAAASCTHHAPSLKPGRSRIGPCEVSRTRAVRQRLAAELLRPAGGIVFHAEIEWRFAPVAPRRWRARSPRRSFSSSAPSARPACRARPCRAGRARSCLRARCRRSTALTRPA